jgi:DNA polymerase II large subunit
MPPLSQKCTDVGMKIALSVVQDEVKKFIGNFVVYF